MYDTVEDVYYGQATDDGAYDDVETFGPGGTASNVTTNVYLVGWVLVVGALAGLWLMGAALFKGSNQS